MMVSNEEKRWLVVGIAMNKVAAPVFRDYIKKGMDTHYANLDIYCSGLVTPCTLQTLTYHHVNTNPSFKHLKFQNVNNNFHLHGKHKNLYNYNISSSVDLAKLFLPDYLAEFSAFDESLDISAILRLLGFNNPAPIFLSPNPLISIQASADVVRENVRNKWGHCNVTDWTEVNFNDCFSKLETLVRSLGLTGGMEKTALDQLSDWKTKGCQLCMGHAVDQNLLSLVQQDVKELVKNHSKTEGILAQQRIEQIEMENTVSCLHDQQSLTRVQLEEHDKQLEAVLDWKEQQMKENETILEKLVSVEKTLSEELLIRVQGVEDDLSGVKDDLSGVNDDISGVKGDISGVKDDLSGVKDDLSGVNDDLSGVKDDLGGVKDDLGGVKDDISGVKDGISGVKDDLSGVNDDLSGVKDDISGVKDDLSGVKAHISQTDEKVKQLEENVRDRTMKDDRPGASLLNTFDVKACQKKLVEHYQKTAKVPTTVWSSVFQVDLDQIYTRLSWVKEEQTLAGSSKKELGHYTELFTEKTKNGAVPKRILVQGETGIGKSTFVKRLLVDWSNLEGAKMEEAKEREGAHKKFSDDECKDDGDAIEDIQELSTDNEDMNKDGAKMEEERKDVLRKFEIVLSINLKDVSKCKTLREVVSHSRLLPRDEESSIDDLLCHIQKHQEKVLVVFDGYDEYRTGSEAEEEYGSRSSSPIYEIFQGNFLRDCTVLVTTRSSRADEIRGPADIQAEITGFSMSDRKDFMGKMLESETQVDGLLRFLWVRKMEDLARVPLLTLFFCLLWKEEKEKLMELTESKTKLFRTIMKHVLQHSHRKHSPVHFSKLKEADYEEVLAEIGKVALEGLLKGDLMFEFGQLPEKLRSEESVIVGLLQVSEYGPSLEPKEMVSFIHKSIQEYLAAWYITYRCVPEGSLGGIEQHAHTLEDCKALENVFLFICGLSDDGAVKVFQHLTSVRISDPTLDLSKTIPDVENETDVPLFVVTDRHRRFSDLVYDSFREVRSKAELLSHCFYCTGRLVLVTEDRPLFELMLNVNVFKTLAQNCVFLFSFISFDDQGEDSVMYKLLQLLNCLQLPLTIPESSKVLTVGNLLRKVQNFFLGRWRCFFSSFLYCRNGQFQFYITELLLQCDDHVRLFTESTVDSDPSVTASLCSQKSCLKFLSSLSFYSLSDQTVKALGAVIRNCKHLNKIKVIESNDSVCDLLEQVPNPSNCSLTIGSSDMRPDVLVHLTSAGAVQLARLLPRFNTITLGLDLKDCCSAAVETLVTSITHRTLERLELSGISLTSKAAAVLGRSLPEMPSLQVLELTGVDGSILQAEDMENLFGGFNRTLPLYKLTFSGFSIRGCLAPLTNSFRFFPSLRELKLEKLDIDEHDQCRLLESFRFIRNNLTALSIREEKKGHGHCYLTKLDTWRRADERLCVDGISLTPAAAAALGRSLPEMSSLQILELTGVDESVLKTEEIEALFGGVNKTLPLRKLSFSGYRVTGCLNPLIKSLCFFPDLRNLKLENLNMDERDQCVLLESLRFISNLTALKVQSKPLGHADRCTAVLSLTSYVYSYANRNDKSLNLDGISLTPAAAGALCRSLPEMSCLRTLELTTSRDGSILEAVELDALFGGFNRTLPLRCLSSSDFSVRSSIGPLTNSFRFFPNLVWLDLAEFNVDEHNLCCLLDSLRFVPNLMKLTVWGKPLSYPLCSTAKVNTVGRFTHKALKEIELSEISLTPAAAAALGQLLPEMVALEELALVGVNGSALQVEEIEALFGRFNKTLPLQRLTVSGFSVTGCLAPLTKSFCFFPNLRELNLGGFYREFNMDEHNFIGLLEKLRFIPNLKTMSVKGKPLCQAHCCTAEVNTTASVTHKTLEELHLGGISLTPAVAAALGRLLPEMSSLKELELTGDEENIVQAEEMEELFGGFSKTLPLYKLTFSGFGVRGCLAPLSKSFCFFPRLRELDLGQLNMNEDDVCSLLESLRFIPNLRALSVRAEHLRQARCYTTESHTYGSFSHRAHDKLILNGISLTPAAATALGRSLFEMSFLQELELTGVHGSILQAKEMKALFGGFNKTMALNKLTLSGFSVEGSIAPLTKSFRFFPNLRELKLEKLYLDEHDQYSLLGSFRFIRDLTALSIRVKYRDSFSFNYCTRDLDTFWSLTRGQVDKSLDLDGIRLTPTVAAALGWSLPEMSSLQKLELTGVDGSILQAEEMNALFGGFNKTLPLYSLTLSGFSVRGCLAPFTKILHFFPNLRLLNLEKLNMDENDLCGLLNALCSTAEVNTMASFTLKSLERLNLDGITLTPAAAAALGRSLPEMVSLEVLELTGVDESILKAEEMELLFGGFSKTLPLSELTFSDFGVTGCLAPLTKSLQFFPSLTYLNLRKLSMDEHDLVGLLESFQFIPELSMLNLSGNPLGHAVRYIVPHVSNLLKLQYLWIEQTGHSEEDFNYVRDTVQQTLPELKIYGGTSDSSKCHVLFHLLPLTIPLWY
ncbi:uncharacterized protein LOC144650892 isoform X2 [Oculina patagonica]